MFEQGNSLGMDKHCNLPLENSERFLFRFFGVLKPLVRSEISQNQILQELDHLISAPASYQAPWKETQQVLMSPGYFVMSLSQTRLWVSCVLESGEAVSQLCPWVRCVSKASLPSMRLVCPFVKCTFKSGVSVNGTCPWIWCAHELDVFVRQVCSWIRCISEFDGP